MSWRKIQRGWITGLLFLLSACGGPGAEEYYRDESLNQTPAQAMAYDGDMDISSYHDNLLDVRFQIDDEDTSAFELTLRNDTDQTMLILWNRVVFQDTRGRSWYMIHDGVDYWQPLEKLLPTRLPPGATHTDLLRPAKVQVVDGVRRLAPLRGRDDSSGELDQLVHINLPLEIYGKLNVYRFRFRVTDPMEYTPYDVPFAPYYNPLDQ